MEEIEAEEITVCKNPLDNAELRIFDGVGEYNIPQLTAVTSFDNTPFISWGEFFNKEVKENRGNYGVHFFVHDYRFQNVWRNIEQYINELLQMRYVITPDFSTYSGRVYKTKEKRINVWNIYEYVKTSITQGLCDI